jgi:hypothetical protein
MVPPLSIPQQYLTSGKLLLPSGYPELSWDVLGQIRASRTNHYPGHPLDKVALFGYPQGSQGVVVPCGLHNSGYPGHPLVDLWPASGYFSALPLGIVYFAYV